LEISNFEMKMIARAVWEGWSLGSFGVGSFAYLIGLAFSPGEGARED